MRLRVDCGNERMEQIHLPAKVLFDTSYKELCWKILNEMILHESRSPGFLQQAFTHRSLQSIDDVEECSGTFGLKLTLVPPATRPLQTLPVVEIDLHIPIKYYRKAPFKFVIDMHREGHMQMYDVNNNWRLCCELYKNGMLHVGDD